MKTKKILSVLILSFILFSFISEAQNAHAALYTIPARVQYARNTNWNALTCVVTLGAAPTAGNTLVAIVTTDRNGVAGPHLTGITSVGATWTQRKTAKKDAAWLYVEIWTATVAAGAGAAITFTVNNNNVQEICAVLEYAGAYTVDVSAILDDQGANPNTGTASNPVVAQEIYIGVVAQYGTSGNMTTPTNGFTLTDGIYWTSGGGGTIGQGLLEKIVSTPSTSIISGVTLATAHSCGAIITLKPTTPPTSYYYTLSAKYENGTSLSSITVTETDSGGSSTLTITNTPTIYYFTTRPLSFIWTVTGGYPRVIEPTTDTGTITITQAQSTTTLFNIQFKDLANVFSPGPALLRISKSISGSSTIVTQFSVPNTISSNPAALIPNTVYTVDLIDANGVTYALGNYIPLISNPTPTFLLASTPFTGLIQFVSPNLQYSLSRPVPYTTITVYYQNNLPAYTTPWANVQWKLRNGTIMHSVTSSGEAITFTWAGATAGTDYIVNLRVYHTFFGNVSKAFIALGPPFSPASPISLVGLGNWGGVAASAIIGIIVLLMFAGLGTSLKPGAAAVMVVLIAAVLAYVGWIQVTAVVLAIGLTFAMIMAINEGRRT